MAGRLRRPRVAPGALVGVLACLGAALPSAGQEPEPEAPLLPVDLEAPGSWLSCFPTPLEPATILLRFRKNVDAPTSIRCRAIIDNFTSRPTPGYAASDPVVVDLAEVGRWYEVAIVVTCDEDRLAMTTGKVLVKGMAGKTPVRWDIPLRLGQQALAFPEERTVPGAEGPQRLDVACLENRYLRAEFLPPLGCLSGLFSHTCGADMLVPGDYPVGLLWAGLSDWYHATQGAPGPEAYLELSSRSAGTPVWLRASLAEDSETLRIVLDAGDLGSSPGPIHLMLTATSSGGDLFRLPLLQGNDDVPVPAAPETRAVRTGSAQTVEYWSAGWDETLRLEVRAQSLASLEIGRQAPWYSYVSLHLGDGPPGVIELSLSLRPGRFE
jgi:hypothetical protein